MPAVSRRRPPEALFSAQLTVSPARKPRQVCARLSETKVKQDRRFESPLVYQFRLLKKETHRGASARASLDRARSSESRMRRAASIEAEPARSPEPPLSEL